MILEMYCLEIYRYIEKEDEIVIYSVGGMPVEDVAWGTIIYRNALKKESA